MEISTIKLRSQVREFGIENTMIVAAKRKARGNAPHEASLLLDFAPCPSRSLSKVDMENGSGVPWQLSTD